MEDNPKDIVSKYLGVLEKREKFGMAMPLSMLTHTKTEIKNAIRTVISTVGDADEQDRLKNGYITLAEFIPDEILKKVDQDWKDVSDAECEVGKEPEVFPETDIMEEVIKVQKGIADEGAQLSQEITEIMNKIL